MGFLRLKDNGVGTESELEGIFKNRRVDYRLEPGEVAAAVPESDKTLFVLAFISCADIDDVYFDKPYYLAPADKSAIGSFVLIREGMRKEKMAAVAVSSRSRDADLAQW